MNYHFQAHRQVRKNLLEILQTTSHHDLLHIPDGFNNNIYWNIAHTVATQQLLCYYLSGILLESINTGSKLTKKEPCRI